MNKYSLKENSEELNDKKIIVIPDLHGNYDAYKNILLKAGIINDKNKWIGNNNYIIFLGDILFDRIPYGIKIIQDVKKLKNQAKKQGGNISIIAGNHEKMGIDFLSSEAINTDTIKKLKINLQMRGANEFIDRFGKLKGYTILDKIKSSKNGENILKYISEFKVVESIGNNLFMHTDTTNKMVEYILNKGIAYINSTYKEQVNNILGIGNYKQINSDILNVFLDTNNRGYSQDKQHSYFGQKEGIKLKQAGYKNIFHGHTYHGLEVKNIGGINIIPLDLGYGKKSFVPDNNTETFAIIEKNGEIKIVTQGSDEGGDKIEEFYS